MYKPQLQPSLQVQRRSKGLDAEDLPCGRELMMMMMQIDITKAQSTLLPVLVMFTSELFNDFK